MAQYGGLTLLAVLGVVIWLGVVGLADKLKQRVWQSRASEDDTEGGDEQDENNSNNVKGSK